MPIWFWCFALSPLAASLPVVGEIFRKIQLLVTWAFGLLLLAAFWCFVLVDDGLHCVKGDVLACADAYEWVHLFSNLASSQPPMTVEQEKQQARHDFEERQRREKLTDAERVHEDKIALLLRYNARNHTNYMLTPDNKVVLAPSVTAPIRLPGTMSLDQQILWGGLTHQTILGQPEYNGR
jgi:hypothetical protein